MHATLAKVTRYVTGGMFGMAVLMGAVWSFQSPKVGGTVLGASIASDTSLIIENTELKSTLAPELSAFAQVREAGPVRLEVPAYSTFVSNRLDLKLTYPAAHVSHEGYTLLPIPAVEIVLTEPILYAPLVLTYQVQGEWSPQATLLLCQANECTPLATESQEGRLRSAIRFPGVVVVAAPSQ